MGATNLFPLQGRTNTVSISLEGQSPDEARRNVFPMLSWITPGYFKAMGIPVLRGSELDSLHETAGPPEAIVSQGLAEYLWAGETPLGRQLRLGFGGGGSPWLTVRGVVAPHGVVRWPRR